MGMGTPFPRIASNTILLSEEVHPSHEPTYTRRPTPIWTPLSRVKSSWSITTTNHSNHIPATGPEVTTSTYIPPLVKAIPCSCSSQTAAIQNSYIFASFDYDIESKIQSLGFSHLHMGSKLRPTSPVLPRPKSQRLQWCELPTIRDSRGDYDPTTQTPTQTRKPRNSFYQRSHPN